MCVLNTKTSPERTKTTQITTNTGYRGQITNKARLFVAKGAAGKEKAEANVPKPPEKKLRLVPKPAKKELSPMPQPVEKSRGRYRNRFDAQSMSRCRNSNWERFVSHCLYSLSLKPAQKRLSLTKERQGVKKTR